MRGWAIGLVLLAGCDRNAGEPQPTVEATPAAVSFQGADYKSDADKAAHGERLSWTLGCRGCHRDNLEGGSFYERYASNLTRELPRYSDADIERLLSVGVPPDGRELWGMPSEIFQHLSDADMKALIAHFRTLKPTGKPTQPPKPWDKETEGLIASGVIKTAKDTVENAKLLAPVDLGPQHAQGRYITMVTCSECHGPKLEGGAPGEPPNLIVAGSYSREQFETLLTKGVAPDGRKLKDPLMGEVARERFTHFTTHERDALYAYLKARAERPQPQ
jgi:mono/diheme cytochrome c family protein